MIGSFVLLAQAALYFALMTSLFRARRRLGIGVFVCALGVMHFLETYLAALYFLDLPIGSISPGSTVLFAGKLAMILLVYIKEDAETVRQPIYGLLAGNLLVVALVLLLRLIPGGPMFAQAQPDMALLDQMGSLMVLGTALLVADSICLILLYERFRRLPILARAFAALAVILSVDQLLFFGGLRVVADVPANALAGNWAAKIVAALIYSFMIWGYLRWAERTSDQEDGDAIGDVFAKLTYRHRYEDLLQQSGTDALTGSLNRGRFDTLGKALVNRALASRRPISVAMIDVDHFKQINDGHGHQVGDEVLRLLAQLLRDSVRIDDKVFRYGGEEFVILWDGLSHESALVNAERLRILVPGSLGAQLAVEPTVSIGLATGPIDGGDMATLIRVADERLYAAKRAGRNQVLGRQNS